MSQPRRVWMPVAVALSLVLGMAITARAAELDNTTQSAVFLLKMSTRFHEDMRHTRMLRALRQLHDPALMPFFAELAQSRDPEMRLHGMLGYADSDPRRRIDAVALMNIKEPILLRAVLSEAMDLNLVTVEQARDLAKWKDVEESVQVVLASFLLRHGEPVDLTMLRTASGSDKLGRASLASLLLAQSGDEAGERQLQVLNDSSDAARDLFREHLLRTAFKSDFQRAGRWALSVATEAPDRSDVRLRHLALQVALRFNTPGAVETWQQMFRSSTDPFERTRLALVALNISPWAEARLYAPLLENDDELLRLIGETGQATAARENVREAVVKAVRFRQTQINDWALDFAREKAEPADAPAIFAALIEALEGPEFGREHRLQHAVRAVTALADRHPEQAVAILRPILTDAKANVWLVRGILSGLLQCEHGNPLAVIAGLPRFDDGDTNDLALLVEARFAPTDGGLSDTQMRNLELLVQGAGRFSHHLRLQAAWLYLQRTDKTRLALAEVTRR